MLHDGCTMPLNDGLAADVAVLWRGRKQRPDTSKGAVAARARLSGSRRDRAAAARALRRVADAVADAAVDAAGAAAGAVGRRGRRR
jgi:hypothetical protein